MKSLFFIVVILFVICLRIELSQQDDTWESYFKKTSTSLLDYLSCDVAVSIPPATDSTNTCPNTELMFRKEDTSYLKDRSNSISEQSYIHSVATTKLPSDSLGIRKSLNHRSEAMNPNAKRYNPTSKLSTGGRTSRRSAARARKMHQTKHSSDATSKSETTSTLNAYSYVLISAFIQSTLNNCFKHGNFSQECITAVGKDVGLSTIIVSVIGKFPVARIIPLIRSVYCGCRDISHKESIKEEANVECVQSVTKLVASIGVTATCSMIPFAGPVVDGVVNSFVGDAVDHVYNRFK
jgi:hypothetical protein